MTALYLTPKRFRTMGTGVDLTSVTDDQLLPTLVAASAMANSYCAAPINHDFRGGTVTEELHRWDIGNVYRIGSQRVWPKHRPVRSVSGFRIDVTNTQYLAIDTNSLYMNAVEGWVEPVALALTTVGMFGYAIMPYIGLKEPQAKISYEYGWLFNATDEYLTPVSGGSLQAPDQFWVADTPIAVKKNGIALVVDTDYSVNTDEGMVTVSSYDSSAIYTASYTYPLPTPIQRATAMIATDLLGQSNLAGAGMLGLSGLRVEEVEIRQSNKVGLYSMPINGAAQMLLDPYVYLSWG